MPFPLRSTDALFRRYCRSGDPRALAAVFDRTAPELLRIAGWLSGNRADAEDLLQRTFMLAIEARATFDSSQRALPWLCGILGNQARNLQREKARRAVLVREGEPMRGPLAAAADAEFAAAVAEARQDIVSPYREVLELHLEQGLSSKDIAARLGRPAGTVRTQLMRALVLLRKRLPSGFVAGLAPLVPDAAALTAVKMAVMAAVKTAGPVAATAGAATTVMATGGVLVTKKTLFVVPGLVLLLAVGIYSGWPSTAGEQQAPPAQPAPSVAVAGPDARTPMDAAAAPAAPAERQPAAAPAHDDDPGLALLLVHVVWSDGTPAAGITVFLTNRQPGLSRPLARGRSDDSGGARFADLPAGKVQLMSDRGTRKEKEVEIAAGQQQEATLELEDGVAVEGVVRDGAAAPVAGADIWLTSFQVPWMAGAVVARSDAQGAFRLRGVPPQQSLGALAPACAPSELVDLELLDTKVQPVHVTLVVGAPGGALAGRVIDTRGTGVAGAMVAVGSSERIHASRSSGTMIEHWSPRTVVTGADGRFTVDSLKPGKQPVEVWSARFPFWHGECEIVADATADLAVELADGVTVRGIVRGADDQPLAGAIVRAFPVAIREDFLQGGQYDYESTFGYPFAVADAAGSYRLERAAPGAIHLFAGPGERRRHGEESVPWAAAVLEGAPGATLEWNPKIEPGPTIAGVVRHRDGVPMNGLFVTAIESGSGKPQTLVTDKQGRFRFVHLQRKPYDLSVQFWSPPKGTPPLGQRDVWPDQGEVELVAAFDSPKKEVNGTVHGLVQDLASRLASPGALAVILQSDKRWWRTNARLDGSAFTFHDVPPGRYEVIVMSVEDPVLVGAWFELMPAEDKQLGTLITQPGGKLRLHLERAAGAETVKPKIFLSQKDTWHSRKIEPGEVSECLVDNLSDGAYTISAYGSGMAQAKCEAKVVAGAETEATLRLQPAVEREILVDYPAEQRLRRIHVQDGAGTVLFDYQPEAAVERPYRMKLHLPLGRFTFEAATDANSAKIEFEMTSLAANQPPVRIEVR